MRGRVSSEWTDVGADEDSALTEQARYVAIVTDGNARWARARGLPIERAHDAAADTVIGRISDAVELGVRELTLYAFSTENWLRPQGEVSSLLSMFGRRIAVDLRELHRRDVRVGFLGRRDRAGDELVEQMVAAEELTAHNEGMRVYVAIDYGGRDEIVSAARRYKGGGEAELAKLLHSSEMHDPDLVIRTGGEQRLSNFLLWQTAYSELVFRSELWPEFGRQALEESLAEYKDRQRRFGGREGWLQTRG